MKIIIAGSRNFNDYELLKTKVIEVIEKVSFHDDFNSYEIISGHASGADSLGERFAKELNYKLKIFPADWDKYGKTAGYIRNREMAEYAKIDTDYSMLIAFWDGKSKGTKNMIDIATNNLDFLFIVSYHE